MSGTPFALSRAPLTPRQRQILRWIADQILTGMPPTVREICEKFGIKSPNGAVFHLTSLQNKGLITVDALTARGITLVGARLLLEYEDAEAGERLRLALEGPEQGREA